MSNLPNCPICGDHALDDGMPDTWCTNELCPLFDTAMSHDRWIILNHAISVVAKEGSPLEAYKFEIVKDGRLATSPCHDG